MIQRFTALFFAALLLASGCRFSEYGINPSGDAGPSNVNQNNVNLNNTNQNNNNNGTCGDGVVDPAEGCDDGNTDSGDGCTFSCGVEHGYDCTGEPSVCSATCGDGVVAQGEQAEACDDGDTDPGDGCAADCTVEPGWSCVGEPSVCQKTCGDGIVDPGEQCDDLNLTNLDGCSDTCQVERGYNCVGSQPSVCHAVCGDGLLAAGNEAEACDDGDTVPGDGCSDACEVELGWDCTTNEPSVCTEICGDELVVGDEDCDCGDDSTLPAGCDEPNSDTLPDACRLDCRFAGCGDGVKDTGEVCDTGDFGGDDCGDHGNFDGGTLACSGDCQTIVTDACFLNCGQHSDCDEGQQCPVDRCEPVGNTCDDSPVLVTASGTFYGTTENLGDSYNGSAGSSNPLSCGAIVASDTAGLDRVYQVTLADGEYLIAWLDPDLWDAVIYLNTACPLTDVGCVAGEHRADDPDGDIGSPERLDYINDTGGSQTLYLVVDGEKNSDWGEYELDITIGSAVVSSFSGGEIIFTEVLPDPHSGGQDQIKCQWFEVHNTSGSWTYNLEGLIFSDAGATSGSFTIDRPLLVPPHGYAVFASRGDMNTNCGLEPVSWVYAGFFVDAAQDLFNIMTAGAIVVDNFGYGAGWPIVETYTIHLCVNHLNSTDNDVVDNWRQTDIAFRYDNPAGDRFNHGTPGEADPEACNPP